MSEARNLMQLTSMDLMQYEMRLCKMLGRFFEFKAHSLHFPLLQPGEKISLQAEYIATERKLMLPLQEPGGHFLGVFVARGVPAKGMGALLPLLPEIASVCLQNMRLYKNSLRDQVTGLFTRNHLFDTIGLHLEQIRERILPGHPGIAFPGEETVQSLHTYSGSTQPGIGAPQFVLLVIRLNGLASIVREHGYMVADRMLGELAASLQQVRPETALAARSGEYEFSVFIPAANQQFCHELGLELVRALGDVHVENILGGRKMRIAASAGYANYPKDLDGMERQNTAEQVRLLLRKARMASAVAAESLNPIMQNRQGRVLGMPGPCNQPVMSFSSILSNGGRVLAVHPLSRLEVSLGRSIGARIGQRFALWGYTIDNTAPGAAPHLNKRYKGEVILTEVRSAISVAEIVHYDDPYFLPEPGDYLVLLEQTQPELVTESEFKYSGGGACLDPSTGFLSHMDFFPAWCVRREEYEQFCLILLRFSLRSSANYSLSMLPISSEQELGVEDLSLVEQDDAGSSLWEALLEKAAGLCRAKFGSELLAGRFALNSFIMFVPNQEVDRLAEVSRELSAVFLKELNLESAFGIAPYPFLDFHKLSMPVNVQKALDYALLLPEPHIGILDSLALNISADRRFSAGDYLGAISEYRQALLCDQDNIIAWNSLGVTLAALGKYSEAEHNFHEAFRLDQNNTVTLYNLANLYQSTQAYQDAKKFYMRCLKLEPENIYTLFRLGQVYEEQGNFKKAKIFYSRAVKLPGGEALTRRGLARIAVKEGRLEEAREELHEALLANPHDALAMQLLAGLYLDAGENPQVAESLARQSTSLRPDLKKSWFELARALEAGGKHEEARAARLKAGVM